MRSKFIFWDWLKDEIKPIVSAISIQVLIFDRLQQHVNSFVRFGCWVQGYFRPRQQHCDQTIIAPPQFASSDEARWLWIYFKIVHHSQDLLSSTFDTVYYFNVIHIYVGFNVS